MDERLRARLDELLAEGRAHDAAEPERSRRFRNVEPESAALMALLVTALGARRVLELGSSNGYSTLWLADAARGTGGRLVSVELDPGRAALARANLAAAGLEAEVRGGDGGALLAASADGAWDFVFLDADRDRYCGWWPDLVRTLAHPGLLVVDNVLSHAGEVAAFRAVVEADARVRAEVVAVGAGLLLAAHAGPAARPAPD